MLLNIGVGDLVIQAKAVILGLNYRTLLAE